MEATHGELYTASKTAHEISLNHSLNQIAEGQFQGSKIEVSDDNEEERDEEEGILPVVNQ